MGVKLLRVFPAYGNGRDTTTKRLFLSSDTSTKRLFLSTTKRLFHFLFLFLPQAEAL
jgi:hypothetical protein